MHIPYLLNWTPGIGSINCSFTITGAHKPELAPPILSIYNGVLTVKFIFSTILQHFFPRKWKHRLITKRNSKCFQNMRKTIFLSPVFANGFVALM